MTAFETKTELYNYFCKTAQDLNCNQCFDDKINEIEVMSEEGSEGHPVWLCKINTACPCEEAPGEIEREGECYCGIFRRK